MRSARISAPGRFELFEEPAPAAGEGQVLVRLRKAVLCGSDYPYFTNAFAPSSYPLPPGYPGHECLGVVERSNCADFTEGDLVMYYPPFLDAYKEYHAAAPSRLQKLPEGIDLNVLVMTQVLGCVAHAVFRIDKPNDRDVVVMGQGPIGLLFTALMKLHGARRVIAVDPPRWRLDTALKLGADVVIDPGREDAVKTVASLTGDRMADIVIDAYGQDVAVINRCFDLARHGGQVAFFGICLEESPRLSFNTFFRKELRMVASVGPDLALDYPYSLGLILRGAVDVSLLVTHVMPFERIQDAFELAAERKDNVIKVVLDF